MDTQRYLGVAAAAWAIVGWSAVLIYAIVKLAAITVEGLALGLTAWQSVVLLANILFMAFAEGYRGFQLKFSPRAAARVLYLRQQAGWATALLAPLFCIGYFRATPQVLRLTYVGTLLIIALVVIVHRLPQPWRGIVDAGVVVGLSWGLWSFWAMSWRALQTGVFPASPAVPGADIVAAVPDGLRSRVTAPHRKKSRAPGL